MASVLDDDGLTKEQRRVKFLVEHPTHSSGPPLPEERIKEGNVQWNELMREDRRWRRGRRYNVRTGQPIGA